MTHHILFSTGADAQERDEWLVALHREMPEARWHLPDANPPTDSIEIAVVANPPPGTLQGLPRLRLIQSLWAGVDRLLSDPTLPADTPIARMVDPTMSAAMAETALWATLGIHRHFFRYARAQHEQRWEQLPQYQPREIHAVVLGVGQMGRATAERLLGHGYRVTGWRQSAPQRPALPADPPSSLVVVHGSASLAPLLAAADVVINLLPLTGATRGLLNSEFFGAMRRGAGLVNLGRGGHLVDQDLLEALAHGQVGHAVLDVFDREPLPAGHPFWGHPAITVLPHIAALTDMRSAAAIAVANIRAALAGAPVAHQVDRTRGY